MADVFWFSAEFGVVREGRDVKAYGAGLLSSPGELDWFGRHAEIRPIDVAAMGRLGYDIDVYQPTSVRRRLDAPRPRRGRWLLRGGDG